MAYVPTIDDPNSPQQLQGQINPSTSFGGGNRSVLGSPQGSTSVPASTQAPPVQDLNAYLKANAPQAVQQGQNIANNLNQVAGKVTGDINSAQQDLSGQIQQSNVTPNSDLVGRAAANPSGFVQNPNDVTAFQQQYNANYSGPTSFESTPYSQTLQNEVTNAQGQAPDITQPQGLAQLARGQEKNPTTGMSNLDALLLQENPDAVKPIAGAIPQFAKLSDYLTGAQSSTDQAIQQAILNDQNARAGVQNTFLTGDNAVVPAWEKDLQNEFSQAQGSVNSTNNIIGQNITAANPIEQALQSYMSHGGQNIQDPLTSILNQKTINQPNESQVATQKDYETQAALQQLLGQGFGNAPLDESNIGQAGTFQVPNIQALNPQQIAQILGNESTGAEFTNSTIPYINNASTNLGGGNLDETDSEGNDLTTNRQSNIFAKELQDLLGTQGTIPQSRVVSGINSPNPNPIPGIPGIDTYSAPNPQAYETLLQYLQSINPSGIGQEGGKYFVNS